MFTSLIVKSLFLYSIFRSMSFISRYLDYKGGETRYRATLGLGMLSLEGMRRSPIQMFVYKLRNIFQDVFRQGVFSIYGFLNTLWINALMLITVFFVIPWWDGKYPVSVSQLTDDTGVFSFKLETLEEQIILSFYNKTELANSFFQFFITDFRDNFYILVVVFIAVIILLIVFTLIFTLLNWPVWWLSNNLLFSNSSRAFWIKIAVIAGVVLVYYYFENSPILGQYDLFFSRNEISAMLDKKYDYTNLNFYIWFIYVFLTAYIKLAFSIPLYFVLFILMSSLLYSLLGNRIVLFSYLPEFDAQKYPFITIYGIMAFTIIFFNLALNLGNTLTKDRIDCTGSYFERAEAYFCNMPE